MPSQSLLTVSGAQRFGDFSDWVNVFKEGKGTITIWENTGGTRGAQIFQLKGIPLTPGPLVVVIKVASSLVKQPAKYWPPALPDCVSCHDIAGIWVAFFQECQQ